MKKVFTFLLGALVAPLLFVASPTMEATTSNAVEYAQAKVNYFIGSDGYYIEREEFRKDRIDVKVIRYQSYGEIGEAWVKAGGKEPEPGVYIKAFAKWNKLTPKTCEMHIVDPRIDYAPHFIGHEFVHCMIGSFHPNQNKAAK